jgi:3-hydroxybutyryl-CoA dehydratase
VNEIASDSKFNVEASMGDITVGQSAALSKTITETDIEQFAAVSLDRNPVHFDEAYAKTTRFGGRIAHGMIAAGLISAVLGTKLPGEGSIYLGQTLQFRAPVRIGDTITATVTVVSVREDKPIATLETVCTLDDGTVVVKGEATILLSA